jgi:DNA repair protein SbcC/Rad50
MRPIVLEMNGFASFREAARIDFTDAEFFALVGPTGSGKSTVIDAMTFALYGSVPRWGRKGMVSLALAPTTARGTVKLVFEVAGQRYVVARELRRVGSQVSQKAASLERLADPRGLAEPGEPPSEVLAGDLAGVTDAVERLLGLTYDDFCQCVVLPQGQFANFLHAKASDRQEILLRLLGAEHYKQMMVRANQRASDAASRAEALDATLATFGDATQEVQDAAATTEAALERLAERADAVTPLIHAAEQGLGAAEAELERLEADRAALAAVRIPGDVAALDAGLAGARAWLTEAEQAEQEALDADGTARAALAGSQERAPLELARERRAERDHLAAGLPQTQDELARLSGLSGQAETAVQTAAAGLETTRARRDAAVSAATAADQRVYDLTGTRAALASVRIPDGIDGLDARTQAAIAAGERALAALEAAEQADSDARSARDSATGPVPLEQARRDLRELAELVGARAPALASLAKATAGKEAAQAALESAEAGREQRQRDVDDARRAHVAAGLRPHLVAGDACPVCEQTVTTLPAPLPEPAIDDAEKRLAQAAAAVTTAQVAAADAAAAQVRAAADVDVLADRRNSLIASLAAALDGPLADAGLTAVVDLAGREPGQAVRAARRTGGDGALDGEPDLVSAGLAEVESGLRACHALGKAADDAAAAVQAARARARAAQTELDQAQAATATASAGLREARDPLVGLGAPAPAANGTSLAGAWAELAAWAAGQAAAKAAELSDAREAAQAAASEREKAEAQFSEATADLTELREDAKRADQASQQTAARLASVTERISKLDEHLRDAPDVGQVTAQLAERDRLEAAAAAAGQRLLGARSARGKAQQEVADLERSGAAAASRLSAARDPLVRLGAPVLDPAGLLAGWTGLQAWAEREATARDTDLGPARRRVATARGSVQELTGKLAAELAAGGVELPAEAVAAGAATAVATALERARGATKRIAERRADAAGLAARRDEAHQEQQVARLLGDLLRSDKFPRWLVTAAIDALVADASVNLAGLSGDQFDLTYEDGEFYVIDHADADSRRSVRTLSGGETFQASLALALALSAQMSTLAAAGAARLDSIFLDEGFGTLDPETLEVVATTLETLAQGQRMVGVITHVAALAERVPVRFLVSRNARTSTVVRQGLVDDGADLANPAGASPVSAA